MVCRKHSEKQDSGTQMLWRGKQGKWKDVIHLGRVEWGSTEQEQGRRVQITLWMIEKAMLISYLLKTTRRMYMCTYM